MAASLNNVNPALAKRVQALLAEAGGKLSISSGHRAPQEQQKLWSDALKKYGSPEAAHKWVAVPGTSNHERGEAVDFSGDLQLLSVLAPKYGLVLPMSWEPWHAELPGTSKHSKPGAYTQPPEAGSVTVMPNEEPQQVADRAGNVFNVLSQLIEGDHPSLGLQAGQVASTQGGDQLATTPIARREPYTYQVDARGQPMQGGAGGAGVSKGLSKEQLANAATIASIGRKRGLGERAITIAIATAMQESSLRNLNYGDRDSLGLFQQRPSQGWGTAAQVTNPEYAANKFYDTLVRIKGYENMPVTQAAQKVQRSAFPDAYAKWEAQASQLAKQFGGQ